MHRGESNAHFRVMLGMVAVLGMGMTVYAAVVLSEKARSRFHAPASAVSSIELLGGQNSLSGGRHPVARGTIGSARPADIPLPQFGRSDIIQTPEIGATQALPLALEGGDR